MKILLRNILIPIAIVLFIGGLMFSNANLTDENQNLEGQLILLKAESKLQQERFSQAQEEADKQMEKAKQQSGSVMKEIVPKNCQEAIKWGIEKAKRF